MKYLLETRSCIDVTRSTDVPAEAVKTIIQGASTFILKAQNIPNMTAVQDTLRTVRGEAKATKEEMLQKMEAIKKELPSTNVMAEKIVAVGEDTKGAAKEAAEVGKEGVAIMREVKNNGLQTRKNAPMSYAAAVASGTLASNITQPRTSSTYATHLTMLTIDRLECAFPCTKDWTTRDGDLIHRVGTFAY